MGGICCGVFGSEARLPNGPIAVGVVRVHDVVGTLLGRSTEAEYESGSMTRIVSFRLSGGEEEEPGDEEEPSGF